MELAWVTELVPNGELEGPTCKKVLYAHDYRHYADAGPGILSAVLLP